MMQLHALAAVCRAFGEEARRADPDAPLRSEIWPTAGQMVDHLGNIQAWATEIVRTGAPVDRTSLRRVAGDDRAEWFSRTSAALLDTLASTDPQRECWTLFDAPPVAAFWGRRMTGETAKHLWDMRTAGDAAPRMPAELSPAEQADVLDEFVEVFVPAARRRGIESLPGDLLLIAEDVDRGWQFATDWTVSAPTQRTHGTRGTDDADIVRADVGDLVLLVWERADPWALPDRFRIDGGDSALRAFTRTPVHL